MYFCAESVNTWNYFQNGQKNYDYNPKSIQLHAAVMLEAGCGQVVLIRSKTFTQLFSASRVDL